MCEKKNIKKEKVNDIKRKISHKIEVERQKNLINEMKEEQRQEVERQEKQRQEKQRQENQRQETPSEEDKKKNNLLINNY